MLWVAVKHRDDDKDYNMLNIIYSARICDGSQTHTRNATIVRVCNANTLRFFATFALVTLFLFFVLFQFHFCNFFNADSSFVRITKKVIAYNKKHGSLKKRVSWLLKKHAHIPKTEHASKEQQMYVETLKKLEQL